jgi:prolyl-tRNA synthetase
VVTVAGGKELDEPIVVRPTSETVFGEYMAKWVQSYRDLPLLLNQWSNIVRWELRPRIFLRTTEFLWQEGHTAHATSAEAHAYAVRILHEVYENFMTSVLSIPVVVGLKTARERFAGAVNTFTLEAMMGDGKALQLGTSHDLGQNFAKVFDIDYLDDSGERQLASTSSWGVTTRMVGGLIMVHGDDAGLRIPPNLATTEVVVLAVRDEGDVLARCRALLDALTAAGMRTHLDDRTDVSLGRRATDWELKGIPVRLELGPRDLAEGKAVLARRVEGGKESVALDGIVDTVRAELDRAQIALLDMATARMKERTVDVSTIDEARAAAAEGWARIPWSTLGTEGEAKLAESAISVRCLVRPDGSVPDTDAEPDLIAVVARSY